MSLSNKDLIREQKLNYWPQSLEFIIDGLLETEPQAKCLVTPMDKGPPKRRPLSSPNLYTGTFNLKQEQYEVLMDFFTANVGLPFAYQNAGEDVILAFDPPQPIVVRQHSYTLDKPEAGLRICEITLKRIR